MMIQRMFIFLSLLCVTTALEGQVGQALEAVSIEDVEIKVCPINPKAKAYYMADVGESSILFHNNFTLRHERRFRIKILDKEALDKASFEFKFFVGYNGVEEKMHGIKGITYNVERGKVRKSRLKNIDIRRIRESKYWETVSFDLPKVKEGSVIEVSYTIDSDLMCNLRGWQFQYDIPVLSSSYSVEIPEFFSYKLYPYGNDIFSFEQIPSFSSMNLSLSTLYSYTTEILNFEASDIPALEGDDSSPLHYDNSSRIEFSYTSCSFDILNPGYLSTPQDLRAPDWSDINNELRTSEDFGKLLSEELSVRDLADEIQNEQLDTLKQINSALQSIKSIAKWNGDYACYASQLISETMSTGLGNISDINLSLVLLLRELDFEAYPVVLRTFHSGFLREDNPSVSQLNYVIVACIINGDILLMDATEDTSSINDLPKRSSIGKGLLVDSKYPRWIALENHLFIISE